MAISHFSANRDSGIASVSHIGGAPHQADRICEIADWVVENVPWTVAVPDWPCFHDRWPLLTRSELAAVEEELGRRGEALEDRNSDLAGVAATLRGRDTYWKAAADWLTLNQGADITHPEFFRLFGQLSRAELILAAIEHRQRLVQRM